jgi:hypothetical protein
VNEKGANRDKHSSRCIRAGAQRPNVLQPRHVKAGNLVDADPIPHHPKRPVLKSTAARYNLTLALLLKIHDSKVRNGREIGVSFQNLQKMSFRVPFCL